MSCKEENYYVRNYVIFSTIVLRHLPQAYIFYKALSFETPLICVLKSKWQTANFRSRHKTDTTVLCGFQS